ncbi:MAG: phosphotransferase [Candidatus Heimdallarchaeota archaeon]|nr:phosphotransferase [Candidatus Heimdallarchaeota archaeon]MCK4771161.1 phosphotransferase [Candidatus Heimdallarchaeota archaeon]
MSLSVLRVKKKLEEYFQKIYHTKGNIEISDVKSLAKGWETELFSFVFRYQEEDQKKEEQLILRIYPGKNMQNKIKWEYEVLTALFKVAYPVPRTHLLELDEEFFGKPFIVMDRINGSDMGEVFETAIETKDWKTITEKLLPFICKLFLELHDLDWRIIPTGISVEEASNPYFFIDRRLTSIEKTMIEYELYELQPILNWLKERRDSVPSEKVSILHQDFHPHNVILSNEGKAYVIDWPSCFVGDFRQDLGWTLLLAAAYSPRELRDDILDAYENELGFNVKEIDFFEMLAAFRRFADIMIMFKFSPNESGLREETVQQIKETVFHVENILSLVREKTNLSLPELEKFIQSIRDA